MVISQSCYRLKTTGYISFHFFSNLAQNKNSTCSRNSKPLKKARACYSATTFASLLINKFERADR